MPIFVTIPCKPLVKQYLHNQYGESIAFPDNDWFKSLFLKFLQHPTRQYENNAQIQYYTATVNLPIRFGDYVRYGNTLTKTSIMHLNQAVQDDVDELLYIYLTFFHIKQKMLLKDAIANFRTEYDFPEESYSTEAITKFFQRARKKRQKTYTQNVL